MKRAIVACNAPTADGPCKLVLWLGGTARDAARPPPPHRSTSTSADDGHGHLLATYSRCSIATTGLERPRRCGAYRYNVTSARERRVPGLGTGRPGVGLPAITSGGRIAFARSIAGGPTTLARRGLDGGPLTAFAGAVRNSDNRNRPAQLGPRAAQPAERPGSPAAPPPRTTTTAPRMHAWTRSAAGTACLTRRAQGNVSGTDVVGVSATENGGVHGSAQGRGEDSRSRLYPLPNPEESSDSRYMPFALTSVSGVALDHAATRDLTYAATAETSRDSPMLTPSSP